MNLLIFPCIKLVRGASSGLERLGREADDQIISSAEVRNVCSCTHTLPHPFMTYTEKILPLPSRACCMVNPFCSCWCNRCRHYIWRGSDYGNAHITCFSLLLVGSQFPDYILPYEFFLRHVQAFVTNDHFYNHITLSVLCSRLAMFRYAKAGKRV
jgi:hypothetical protein